MRTCKTKAFARFAAKTGISDVALCRAVRDAERGLIAADIGGGVIKQRIARPGQGKSLKKLAAELLACDDIRIARAVASEALEEFACDEKTIP